MTTPVAGFELCFQAYPEAGSWGPESFDEARPNG
jgi:hypothetical protein